MIKLIIADDEHITRLGLQSMDWENEGFRLEGAASTGPEALAMVRSLAPDLLVTDIRMPGMDGLTLMQTLKQEYPKIKVVFITAYHQLDYALSAIELGAVGFVLKPTDPDEILEVCRKAKDQIEAEREQAAAETHLRQQLKEYTLTLQGKVLPEADSGNAIVATMTDFLEHHYMEDVTIGKISEELHFHPDYLSRLFKKETGENFSDTLTRIRMQKAVEHLADPEIRVYEIAAKVGIKDARYFGQMFKKRFGLTPNEFRQQQLALIDKDNSGRAEP